MIASDYKVYTPNQLRNCCLCRQTQYYSIIRCCTKLNVSFAIMLYYTPPCSVTVETIEFVRTLEDITLNELGVQATFECEVSKDGLKAEWLKNGKPIKAGENYEMTTEATIHRLVIKKAYAEDEAEYTVVLKDAKSVATLAIKGTL